MLKVIGLAILMVALAWVLFSVRILFLKNGQFKGTCANNNPFMQKQGVTCGVCGRKAGEACQDDKEQLEKVV
jgi:hypothetical protein